MSETVRMWRPEGYERLLLMHGRTSAYAVDPSGEYVVGVIARGAMRMDRGGRRHVARAGDVVVCDPSHAHRGVALQASEWACRLMVIELSTLAAQLDDAEERIPLPDCADPVIRDRRLAAGFERLHRALEGAAPKLERDALLAEWLSALGGAPMPNALVDQPALRRACELLNDDIAANPSLDDLARAAGVGRFRLLRLFRAGVGLPPHRYLLAQRIRLARRMLERGVPIGEVAAATGFADQSHLHRHFRRTLGVTPGQYAGRVVQQRSRRG
jgi:AraC-like DNA-binding protein